MRDDLGRWGEAFFHTQISKFHGPDKSLFLPQFLGDKFPDVDYLVELQGATGQFVPFFFVQVKTTIRGYTTRTNRLRIQVPLASLRRLALYPTPVYIAGVDYDREIAYLAWAGASHTKGVTSLCTDFPIDQTNREILWREVMAYWTSHGTWHTRSVFTDPDWS